MENKNLQKLASALRDCLEEKERKDGEKFLCIKNDLKKSTEEKIRNLIHAAHGDGFLPDDYKYRYTCQALEAIADGMTEEEIFERADAAVDIYNHDLLAWISSHLFRGEYVSDAVQEFGYPEEGFFTALQYGQLQEIEEVYLTVYNYLKEWDD